MAGTMAVSTDGGPHPRLSRCGRRGAVPVRGDSTRVLVVGSGAREHALVWKLQFSPGVSAVFCAPGNAGISFLARSLDVGSGEFGSLVRAVKENQIDLTIIGPEVPLADGIVDRMQESGLRVFGPTQAAAHIESSKLWAKDLMQRHGIPTARWAAAESPDEARARIREFGAPLVLKADGLAGGKGAVVCHTESEADAVVEEFMVNNVHGTAGQRLVVEEFLDGRELSVFALADGKHVLPLIAARDHKPLLDDDRGPNTGGMGGYTRPRYATDALMDEITSRVLEPTAWRWRGAPTSASSTRG
ncbi:MAG: phosphoribosylamine/glycine ligase [Chloroflexi bacterium]|nr:phosphoribosylamine/glycine ligase [Chloroflexota bacterium]